MSRAGRQREPRIVRVAEVRTAPPGMRRVTVNTLGDNFISLDAWVFGEWAAHRRLRPGTGIWDVTFLPSGMNISSADGSGRLPDRKFTEAQAKRAADWLDAHITREELYDWSSPTAELRNRVYQGLELASASLDAWVSARSA